MKFIPRFFLLDFSLEKIREEFGEKGGGTKTY
jgi:hypothetical protein